LLSETKNAFLIDIFYFFPLFFLKRIFSADEASNKEIQNALIEGFIVVFSESTNKFFLVYKDISKYREYLQFKKIINNLELLSDMSEYLNYEPSFKKMSNKNLFELKYIYFEFIISFKNG
jgi:hypothetical protein